MTATRTVDFLRTPDEAFKNLKDYPFKANYIDVGGLRMHYVDEGQDNSGVIFLLHGQPSWSYLYRHMIPVLVRAGYRVIAPDLIGFGKSDKPVADSEISYRAQVAWMCSFVRELGISSAAAFMQDWGGMIGLRVLAERPGWLSKVVLANTALADVKGLGQVIMPRMLKAMRFLAGRASLDALAAKQSYGNWASYFHHDPSPDIGGIMQILTVHRLEEEVLEAYRAPFPGVRYMAAPRVMPQIVGTDLREGVAAWEALRKADLRVLTLFSDKDPFLADRGIDKQFQALPGAQNQPHQTISNASHFLQEDAKASLAYKMIDWLDG
ncbi:haloalkane dehalogenase [Roseibium sp. SCP14]|uniref:haloalkane dehalogenase n=1 Tax=Roseibium sp. SCP14 TaxID=3141375 RepID=UPI003336FCE1